MIDILSYIGSIKWSKLQYGIMCDENYEILNIIIKSYALKRKKIKIKENYMWITA